MCKPKRNETHVKRYVQNFLVVLIIRLTDGHTSQNSGPLVVGGEHKGNFEGLELFSILTWVVSHGYIHM